MVHRDIKPANVFLHRGHEGEIVKVVDFGIAKLLGEAPDGMSDEVTRSGVVVGSPSYMAPERMLHGEYDDRADVYSLGVVLYQMLTGHLPYEEAGRNFTALALRAVSEDPPLPSTWVPDLPRQVESQVLTAMDKRVDSRPRADQFAIALRLLRASLDHDPGDAVGPDGAPRSAPTFKEGPRR